MIFSVGRVLNLAYGVYIMIGGYVYYVLAQLLELPKIPSFCCAALAGAAFGLLTYLGLVRRLRDNPIAVEISTLILAVVMQAVVIIIFSPAPKAIWPMIPGVIRLFGVPVTYQGLILCPVSPWTIFLAMIISWVILSALLLFVQKTALGRAIRAVSMDTKGALVAGIDAEHINLLTWGLSGALGAIAGVFFASYTQLDPTMWVFPLIIAVAVVIVGGIGSIIGSLIAAHIVGEGGALKKSMSWWLFFAVVMGLIPLVSSSHTLRIFIFANFLAIFAMSWDVLSGYTGYISFGHPFLIGIGAYTTAP